MTEQEKNLREAIRKEIRRELTEAEGMSKALDTKVGRVTQMPLFKQLKVMVDNKSAKDQFLVVKDMIDQFDLKPAVKMALRRYVNKMK